MQRPNSRIISHKVHDHVSRSLFGVTWLQNKCVATSGILEVGDAIPLACSFGHDPVVVAVEVHGVLAARGKAVVVDDDAHGTVAADVVDSPIRVGVRGVASVGEEKNGVSSWSVTGQREKGYKLTHNRHGKCRC